MAIAIGMRTIVLVSNRPQLKPMACSASILRCDPNVGPRSLRA